MTGKTADPSGERYESETCVLTHQGIWWGCSTVDSRNDSGFSSIYVLLFNDLIPHSVKFFFAPYYCELFIYPPPLPSPPGGLSAAWFFPLHTEWAKPCREGFSCLNHRLHYLQLWLCAVWALYRVRRFLHFKTYQKVCKAWKYFFIVDHRGNIPLLGGFFCVL